MIKEDYLVKKIKQIVYTLLTPLLGNKDINDDSLKIIYEKEVIDLKSMIDNKQINEAENILFNYIDDSKKKDFYLCLIFYDYLNKKDNEFLKNSNFTRKEIEDGLFEICDIFDYTNLISIFKDK